MASGVDVEGATQAMRAQRQQDSLANAQQEAEDKKANDQIQTFKQLVQGS